MLLSISAIVFNRERGKNCSVPRQNKMMRNSCSWARLRNEGRIAGLQLLLPFPQPESRDRDARILTRPAPRLVWSGAASVGSAPFFCRKKSTKSHWIAHWVHLYKAGPPLDLSFWSFFTFLHNGMEEVERHLLWKFHKKIQRISWWIVPPKLRTCIRFLYKVVHKIGRFRKFNRAREVEFNFFIAWTIFMKLGTLVQHAHGYKMLPQIF